MGILRDWNGEIDALDRSRGSRVRGWRG
jgi:hypothetical protein